MNSSAEISFRTDAGSVIEGRAYTVANDRRLVPVRAVRPMPTGHGSVIDMLAAKPFLVAHRGGSANWPEMSLYAYTQSVYYGAGALEVSLARSSDGVWFGLHDQTLDRTAGTVQSVAAQQSWSEIRRHRISASATSNPLQPARPYMRWEELVDAYYPSHVLFIDPKYATAYIDELLTMLDALPGEATQHIIAKDAGTATDWPSAARARGYTTWGYYYGHDVPDLLDTQDRFDLLGMEYGAPPSAWAAATSFRKPVIAHVVPSLEAARRAAGLGAAGIMASDIEHLGPAMHRLQHAR